MTNLSAECLAVLSELAAREPEKALAVWREYESVYGLNRGWVANRGGLLVDIGSDLGRPDLVKEGIERLKAAITEPGRDTGLVYNLANGYVALAKERSAKGDDYVLDPDSTPWLQAKMRYREALTLGSVYSELRAQLWVNYGNCLSGLGRSVEAISAYDQALQIVPGHAMAKGNMGVELLHFARIAQHPIFVRDAQRLLDEALASPLLERYGGQGARESFQRSRRKTENILTRWTTTSSETCPAGQVSHWPDYERAYVEACARDQLFLNFCLRCRRCPRYCKDSLGFSLRTDADDTTSFVRLSRVMNEIKERYSLARLLLFQAMKPRLDTVAINQLTDYVDNLDYAVHGVREALLKQAFESAYNILDKIAHFLNDYLGLGVKRHGVSFYPDHKVWRKRGEDRLRRELSDLRNWHLFALYDLARDLQIVGDAPEQDGYYGGLRRTRNALTHEYVVLHVESMHWDSEADDAKRHMPLEAFVAQTKDLLRLVRAAVIYLIAFVDAEEAKKHLEGSGFAVPMFVPRYDAALFDWQLDI